jgi:CRISPR type I-E-associated protein CasB/Cse2
MTEHVGEIKTTPFRSVVGKLLSEIDRAFEAKSIVINRGDISGLRRMDIDAPVPCFWKLMAGVQVDGMPRDDRRWAIVVKAMAMMAPNAQSKLSAGAALASSGFSSSSDLRITRLLKAEGAAFDDYALSAVRYLASKAVGASWWSLADFLYWPDQKRKQQLAKDFYLQNSKKD